jgi:hypothetical protein
MTREEAIEKIEEQYKICKTFYDLSANPKKDYPGATAYMEALEMAISALRPITREQVEKVWRGCPECKPSCGLCVNMNAWDRYGKPDVCNRCVDYSNFESDQKFCECCGSPLTDEAVEMVMERLEALYGNR